MALVLLTQEEKQQLEINSFDPRVGALGVGFTYLRSTRDSGNTTFTNIYSINNVPTGIAFNELHLNQTITNNGLTTNAFTLNKDV